jgi:hypothetical protein
MIGFGLIFCSICSCSISSSHLRKNLKTVTVKPSDEQLIGVYKPDVTTIQNLPRYGIQNNSSFRLSKGGRLEYRQIPIRILDFTEDRKNNNTLLTGQGEWKINDRGYIELDLIFKLDENNTLSTPMVLTKQLDKYIIYYFQGDPNKDSVAVFIQE